MKINKAVLVKIPKIEDYRGNLSFIEVEKHIPFDIERTYWIYDVPGGQVRGGHAFKEQFECIIALSGSFTVTIDYGQFKEYFEMNRSYYALFVPAGIWRQMDNFSTNSIALVLCSTQYTESDYIRNYQDYLIYINETEK
jgi:hypothetical protein